MDKVEITALRGFFRWVFPNYTRYAYHITDFPLPSWDALPQTTLLPPDALQAMTFYYVNQHFGQLGETQSRHPLRGCLVPHFRYCPVCLAENGYASLLWRFTLLTGCPQHQIRFQEACPICGHVLPLFQLRALRYCPNCHGHLCEVATETLPRDEVDANAVHAADLTVLLQPPRSNRGAWQTAREAAGLSMGDMARALGVSRRRVSVFEWGRTGMNLTLVLRYCDQLGLCLRDILAPETITDDERQTIAFVTTVSCEQMERDAVQTEREVLQQLQHTADQLRQEGLSVTVTTLSQRTGVNTSDLNNYPTVRDWLDSVRQQRYAQQTLLREEELLAVFETVTAPILAGDMPFRVGDVCEEVGMSSYNLRCYPSIARLLDELVSESQKRRQVRQVTLLNELNDTIVRLETTGETVTRQTLQQEGLSLAQLNHYAMTRRRLESVPDAPRPAPPEIPNRGTHHDHWRDVLDTPRPTPTEVLPSDLPPQQPSQAVLKQEAAMRWEQDLRERIRTVLAEHGQLPVRLSLNAVARLADVSPSMIRSRPDLLTEVREVIVRTPYYPSYSAEEVQSMIWATCETLAQDGQPPTLTAIYQHLAWSRPYLNAMPDVQVICKQTLQAYEQQQQRQNQDNLLQQVKTYLNATPEVVSYAVVARVLGCRPEHLQKDARICHLIETTRRQTKAAHSKRLWEEVQTTVASWQTQGVPVTQQALIQHLDVTVGELNRHEAVRELLERIRADNQQQWQHYLDDLTIRAQEYVQQRQAARLLVTQEMIAAHLGVNTSKLDSYPGTRAVFDALNALKPAKKQELEQALLAQVETAIEALQAANLPVHQKSIAAYLGRSPRGLKYYPLVHQRLQEVIQANSTC